MRERMFLLAVTLCMIFVSACAGAHPDENAAGTSPPAREEGGTDAEQEEEPPEYPSPDAGSAVRESPLGYRMAYDPAAFTLDDTAEGMESYQYLSAEPAAPVHVSIQAYADMEARTLAEGLALQSGMDDVTVQDTCFGKDNLEAWSVAVEKTTEEMVQTQVFYVLPASSGSLLIEIGGYAGMPETAEGKIEEMLASFTLTK